MTSLDRPRWAWAAAGSWMLLAYLLVAAVGVVSIRVFTELAPPAVFGEANLVLTALTLALTAVSTPFTNTQLRFHSAAQAAGRGDGFTRRVLFHVLGAGALVCGGAAIIWGWLAMHQLTRLGPMGAAAAGALGLLTLTRGVLFGRVQAERRMRAYAGLLVGEAMAAALLTAAMLRWRPTVDGYVLGQAAGMALAVLAGLAVAPGLSGVSDVEGDGFGRQVKAYGLPFAPMSLLSWLANTADRYALAGLAGPQAAGRYVAAFSIASRGVLLVGGALNDLYRPALFAAVNAGRDAEAREIFRNWLLARVAAALACILGLWALGPWLSSLLLAPAYREGAGPILLWIAGAYGVQGVNQVVENRLMSLDRTRRLVVPLLCGGLANLAFSLLLIPRLGALGAAQATTASFIVQGLITAIMLRG